MKTEPNSRAAKAQHTQGDWYWCSTPQGGARVAVKDGNSEPITIAWVQTGDTHGRLTGDQVEANARLITSAPKLWAALETANNTLRHLQALLETIDSDERERAREEKRSAYVHTVQIKHAELAQELARAAIAAATQGSATS